MMLPSQVFRTSRFGLHAHGSRRIYGAVTVRNLTVRNLMGSCASSVSRLNDFDLREKQIRKNVGLQKQFVRFHGHDIIDPNAKSVSVVFVKRDGEEQQVEGKVGQNLLRLAQKNDIELEGACECSLACSTCHVILESDIFDQLEYPEEDEEDMLDMAFGLTETSRLGCQIHLEEYMDGMKVVLPKATRNFYVDGHVPQPH